METGYFSHEEMFVGTDARLAITVGVDTIRIDALTKIVKVAGGDWEIKKSVYGISEIIAWATLNAAGTWSICRQNGTDPFALADAVCVVGDERHALKMLIEIAKGDEK
ncbi:MAG: hypothetical protein VR70_12330 [Rhodospirillaceae bacterium BRH_c57]|nr:MAG: hypothetical protein VR70_12330 [Rhodospirillaceae bacterium BRH_c57]